MIMTKEDRRIRSRTCPGTVLSTTYHTGSSVGLIPSVRGKRPVTSRQIYGHDQDGRKCGFRNAVFCSEYQKMFSVKESSNTKTEVAACRM